MLNLQTVERTLPQDGQERPSAPLTRPISAPSSSASHAGGTRAPRVVTLDLSSARDGVELLASGTAIMVRSSTNATDQITVQYDGEGDDVPFTPGSFIAGVAFNKLRISNDAIASATMTLLIFNELPGLPLRVL